MIGKSVLFGILFIFVSLASGCTIIKGTGGAAYGIAQGTGCTAVAVAQNTAGGFSQGFKDDVGFIKKADNWVRENLW
ncbi:MAG: hypothetical protein PHC29_02250 [Candidatus Omnitrophica bacterium]|nr:hypothetical protein [Candidatus Omnitrophota bacterium]